MVESRGTFILDPFVSCTIELMASFRDISNEQQNINVLAELHSENELKIED